MTEKVDTLKISELIRILEGYKKCFGDLPVIHSSDCEGNSYNTITKNSVAYIDTDKVGKVFVLFPNEEYIDDELFD